MIKMQSLRNGVHQLGGRNHPDFDGIGTDVLKDCVNLSRARNCGVTSMMARTPVVFCAVSAVIAVVAYTPFIVMALMSA